MRNEESVFEELEKEAKEYSDILEEINKSIRRETRKIGVRKNVIPVKYILPRSFIERLLRNKWFRRTWEGKVIWRVIEDKEGNKEWVRIEMYPNIGGVRVEEGESLQVILEKIPRRRRIKR